MNRNRWMSVMICVCGSMLFSPQASAVDAQSKTSKIYLGVTKFDQSREKLPPNFKGHDLPATLDLLSREFKKIKGKDDFETDGQYRDRRTKQADSIKMQLGIDATMLLGFVGSFDKWSYTPEKSLFSTSERFSIYSEDSYSGKEFEREFETNPSSFLNVFTVNLINVEKKIGQAAYVNAFGKTFNVPRLSVYSRGLYVAPCFGKSIESWKSSTQRMPSNLWFNMEVERQPAQARMDANNLRVLYLVSDFVNSTVWRDKETVKYSPPNSYEEQLYDSVWGFVKLKALWVFNQKTGEILKKIESCSVGPDEPGPREVFLF